MKRGAGFRVLVLLAASCGLAAMAGCGGGGGGGGDNPSSPSITTTTLPAGVHVSPYSAALSATGGTPPYTWSATGLPAGLSVSADGTLAGTPTEEGAFTPEFTVTDSLSMQTAATIPLRIATPLALFVADLSTPSGAVNIFDNASVADGDSAWTRRLQGTSTTLNVDVGGPPAGVSYDAARNILYVARTQGSDNGAILAFHNADTATGNVEPTRTIDGFSIGPTPFPLNSCSDVFIDSVHDRIYIANVFGVLGNTIVILDNASTTPVFRSVGNLAYVPAAMSVDVGRDILYVVPNLGTAIMIYDDVSAGLPPAPTRTITIGTAVGLADVKVDPVTDIAFVADYEGNRVFVVNDASQKDGAHAPDRTLTGLVNPNSVFPDAANDRLFVSSRTGPSPYAVGVVENMSTVSGSVTFSRQLSGFGVAAGMTGFYK